MYFARGIPQENLVLIRRLCVHLPELFGPSLKEGPPYYWQGNWSMLWCSVAANLTGLRTIYYHVGRRSELTVQRLEDCLSAAAGWVVGDDFNVKAEDAHGERGLCFTITKKASSSERALGRSTMTKDLAP